MVRKKERTMERYMKAGAEMRLFKNLGAKMRTAIGYVLSAADQDKLMRAVNRIDEVCSKAEDNMFCDYPNISNEYTDVFYGNNVEDAPRNGVDKKIIEMAREAADELFTGKRY